MPYLDPEKTREANRRWYARNRDREAAKRRKWHQDNREQSRAISRAYYKANTEKVLQRTNHAHRARITSSEGLLDWINILKADPCSYCGQLMQEIDHIESLSQGGSHSWDNLTSACRYCNRSKHTKSLLEFLQCL